MCKQRIIEEQDNHFDEENNNNRFKYERMKKNSSFIYVHNIHLMIKTIQRTENVNSRKKRVAISTKADKIWKANRIVYSTFL